MHLRQLSDDPLSFPSPLLVVGVVRGEGELSAVAARADEATGGVLSLARERGDFQGRPEDELLVHLSPGGNGPQRILFLGTGPREEVDREALRRWAARGVRGAERLRLSGLSLWLDEEGGLEPEVAAQAAAEGAALAAWRFEEFRAPDPDEGPTPPVEEVGVFGGGAPDPVQEGLRVGLALARGENLARTLQARPGNVATPSHLAEEADRLASEHGLEVRILGPAELEAERMTALLAVARGSMEEPRLIVLTYGGGGPDEPPLVLVGKGLTFDAGGISLKPAQGMEDMKYDMSGGAAVLGALQAVAELGLKVNVVGVIPSAENLPSGRALKPGDVISTRAGKRVEVVNTDAEGRLILADALSFAADLEPRAVVDCATLTGACVVALGHHASAVLGSDSGLVEELREAGERSGERCWPLPLWKEYRDQLKSEVADLRNVGGRPAGTITAAAFLEEFVGDRPWAHLDIAGTAYGEGELPYRRKGAFGVPTRLLVEWIRARTAG